MGRMAKPVDPHLGGRDRGEEPWWRWAVSRGCPGMEGGVRSPHGCSGQPGSPGPCRAGLGVCRGVDLDEVRPSARSYWEPWGIRGSEVTGVGPGGKWGPGPSLSLSLLPCCADQLASSITHSSRGILGHHRPKATGPCAVDRDLGCEPSRPFLLLSRLRQASCHSDRRCFCRDVSAH